MFSTYYVISFLYLYYLPSCAENIQTLWEPVVSFTPNLEPFIPCTNESFQKTSLPENDKVEWYSIEGVESTNNERSYVVFGGAVRNNVPNHFATNRSLIIKCTVQQDRQKLFNLNIENCTIIDDKKQPSFRGWSMKRFDKDVLITCDPLTPNEKYKIVGQCTKRNLNSSEKQRAETLLSKVDCDQVGVCYYGFSLDVINKAIFMFNPLSVVQFIYRNGYLNKVSNPFVGFSVKSIDGFRKWVSSGILINPIIYNDGSIDTILAPTDAKFGSFGFSLLILQKKMILIGAPFNSIQGKVNTGSVYLYYMNQKMSSFIHGPDSNGYFGYSTANLGDINFDKIDDFAVGAPFFDEPNQGKVYIYTLSKSFTIDKRPYQILQPWDKSSLSFGIALSSGMDIDSNRRPDLLVLSQKSKRIELFSLRPEYMAVCKFIIPKQPTVMPKNYVTPLIVVKITLTDRQNQSTMSHENNKLVHQINADMLLDKNRRFELSENSIVPSQNGNELLVKFKIKSMEEIKKMNFTQKFLIGYRYVLDCHKTECYKMRPLINWKNCFEDLNLVQYHCKGVEKCSADLDLTVTDETQSKDVFFGNIQSMTRKFKVTIKNNGPTESKDILLKITNIGNMNNIVKMEPRNVDAINSHRRTSTGYEGRMDLITKDLSDLDIDVTVFLKSLDQVKTTIPRTGVKIEVISGVSDPNMTNNVVYFDFPIIYNPKLKLSYGKKPPNIIYRSKRPQPIKFGQPVQADAIGPYVQHAYKIENRGNSSVHNINVTLQIPIKFSDQSHIIYLMEKIRGPRQQWISVKPRILLDGNETGSCIVNEQVFNPLNLAAKEIHESHSDASQNQTVFRTRRSLDIYSAQGISNTMLPQAFDYPSISQLIPSSLSSSSQSNTKAVKEDVTSSRHFAPVNRHEVVRCNRPGINIDAPICVEVICNIPKIPINKIALLQVNGWLFTPSFFKKHISDVYIFTDVTIDAGQIPNGVVTITNATSQHLSISQYFLFERVKPPRLYQYLIWPIILGIVLGVLALLFICYLCYQCGFFDRKRHYTARGPTIVHLANEKQAFL